MSNKSDETITFMYKGKKYSVEIEGNLVLNDMSVTEVKDALNDVPGRFAYWKSFDVTVKREIEDLEEEYDVWFAEKYQEIVDREAKKPTETAIKNMVILDNADEFRKKRKAIRDLQEASNQLSVLTKAYDMQLYALKSIANLTYQELDNIEAHGKRNLSDL